VRCKYTHKFRNLFGIELELKVKKQRKPSVLESTSNIENQIFSSILSPRIWEMEIKHAKTWTHETWKLASVAKKKVAKTYS
jgi:hypothetical protein